MREGISIPLPTPPLDSPYPPLNDQGAALDRPRVRADGPDAPCYSGNCPRRAGGSRIESASAHLPQVSIVPAVSAPAKLVSFHLYSRPPALIMNPGLSPPDPHWRLGTRETTPFEGARKAALVMKADGEPGSSCQGSVLQTYKPAAADLRSSRFPLVSPRRGERRAAARGDTLKGRVGGFKKPAPGWTARGWFCVF